MAKRLWDKGESLNSQVQTFTIGTDPEVDLNLIGFDAAASAAHARMLAQIGILSKEELPEILNALAEVLKLHSEGKFSIPFELEDGHTAIESFLVEKLGDTGKKIHTGRSRNDQVLVAVRLYMREQIGTLLTIACELCDSFTKRADETMDTVLPGYTHFQRAMPTSFGVWFHAYAEMLLRSIEAGEHLLEEINCNPLGAASGFGVPLALDRSLTAKLLGFSAVQRNPIAVVSARGQFELRCIHWCTEIASIIEKFASDVVLYCTEEFAYLKLPDDFTTGSSIMPQKRNPDVAELMRAKTARIRSAAAELEWVIAKLPANYHRDHQLSKEPLCKALNGLSEQLSICRAVVESVEICPERAEAVFGDELFATYEAYRLVESGKSFRDSYVQAAKHYKEGQLDLKQLRAMLDKVLAAAKIELASCKQETAVRSERIAKNAAGFQQSLESVFSPK